MLVHELSMSPLLYLKVRQALIEEKVFRVSSTFSVCFSYHALKKHH